MIRARAARWAAALVALALLPSVTGCGIRPTGIVVAGGKPAAGARPGPVTLYLLKQGGLVAVQRPGLPDRPFLGVEQLAVPTTAEERRAGLTSQVPDVKLTASVMGDAADPPERLEVFADRKRKWSRLAFAQVACTAAAVRGIRRTSIQFDPDAPFGPSEKEAHAMSRMAGFRLLTCEEFGDLR